ncbi:hypothetical protein N6G94_10380 (plasmid) [Pediococcus inopinatus]|uniref:hypothetical protein n=1 Tax=Pediococcus inopinatus TaxID=114090 RepID=UPI002B25CFC5|nr:hypothetical protein [Pediococcus inopinatus]WPC18510.1 hypothetical protein N6G94_10380 [Pediococcus inopinatus]
MTKPCEYCHVPFKPFYKTKFLKLSVKPGLETNKYDMAVDEFTNEVHIGSFMKDINICPVCGREL